MISVRILGVYLYASRCRMRKRQRRERTTKDERSEFYRDVKRPVMQMAGFRCAICGKRVYRGGQLHHVLPYTLFPEYEREIKNIMLLCVGCHNEVHRNPYINISLMEKKSMELGCYRKLLEIKSIAK